MGHRDKAATSQPEVQGMDKVVMGEMGIKMMRRSIEIQELVQKVIVMKRVIQKTYEFEITSQQLSQVTPGGGALKIKLSKKKTTQNNCWST